MEQQEYSMRMQMLGQEAEKLEQHMQVIEQQISELGSVKESIEGIITKLDSKSQSKNNKEIDREILANLGKGIFVKADVKNEDLFINVGKEVIVRKKPNEAIKIIDEQLVKLVNGKEEIISRISELQGNMQAIMQEAQKAQSGSQSTQSEDESECICEGNDKKSKDCKNECGDKCKCK